jgi:hypothetical protein
MALVQTTPGSATGANTALSLTAFGSNTTTGNAIIVVVNETTALNGVVSITDTQLNTYARVDSGTFTDEAAATHDCEIWIAQNITGGASNVVKVNHTSSGIAAIAREYSGLATASASDKVAHTTGTGTALSSGATATTTQANELVIGWGGTGHGATITYSNGAGFANATTSANSACQVGMDDLTVAATGAQTGLLTINTSSNWFAGVATFKIAGGAAPVNPELMTMGIGT